MFVQCKFCNDPLQMHVLVSKLTKLPELAYAHSTVLALPSVEGLLAYTQFPANLPDRPAVLSLLQGIDDLFFRIPLPARPYLLR